MFEKVVSNNSLEAWLMCEGSDLTRNLILNPFMALFFADFKRV